MKFSPLEKLSWIPRQAQLKIFKNRNNLLKLNFNLIGINKNFEFHVLPGDEGLSRELKAFGFREPINSKIYHDFISPDDIVLDIGANLGFFSILSSNAKKIISVEPIKECIPTLEKNLRKNDLEGKSIVVNKAVGNKDVLYLKKMNKINHSRIVSKMEDGVEVVQGESLKYFVNNFGVNTLRMDLEGYEYDILYKKDLSKIDKICMEFHTGIIGEKKVKKFFKFMQEEGFIIRHMIDELPLRLYPFYKILKKTGLIKRFTSIKKDIMPRNAYPYLLKGRSVKHLNLERK